jgi:curved DNA-binding protein CbpA
MNTDFDPYVILGVEKDASTDNIRKAFKQKSKTAHPDHGGSSEEFGDLKKAMKF